MAGWATLDRQDKSARLSYLFTYRKNNRLPEAGVSCRNAMFCGMPRSPGAFCASEQDRREKIWTLSFIQKMTGNMRCFPQR